MSTGLGLFSVVSTSNHLVSKIPNSLLPSRWVKTALLICFSPYKTLKASNPLRKYERFFLHLNCRQTRFVWYVHKDTNHGFHTRDWWLCGQEQNKMFPYNSTQFAEDSFEAPIWPPFRCLRTRTRSLWRDIKAEDFQWDITKYFAQSHRYLWSPRSSWSHISLQGKNNFQIRN